MFNVLNFQASSAWQTQRFHVQIWRFRDWADRTDLHLLSCYCVRYLIYASVLYVHTIVLLFTDAEIKGELFIFPKYVQKEAFEAKLVEFHSMHIMRWSSY